jgi:hypothetical protein
MGIMPHFLKKTGEEIEAPFTSTLLTAYPSRKLREKGGYDSGASTSSANRIP